MLKNDLRVFIVLLIWIFYVDYVTHKIMNHLKIIYHHLKSFKLL